MKVGLEKLENYEGVAVKVLLDSSVMLQIDFLWKITFDTLYTNRFSIRIRSRTLSISSERNTI